MHRHLVAAAPALALLAASPALAQSAEALPDPNKSHDTLTIGVGAAYIPDYEGSNDYRVIPAAAIRGQVSGIGFSTSGTRLSADLFPRHGKFDLDAGPIVGVRLNRTGKVHDPLVNLLPRRKAAFEVGGFTGFSLHGLTNPYDSLSFKVEATRALNAYKGWTWGPRASFSTPLSRRTYVSLDTGFDFASNRYADYYYSITPAESLASTLPAYNAGGGYKAWKVGFTAAQSLTGNLLHGWSLFALVNHTRLYGDFARSPIVAQRGSREQWQTAIGLGYTF
ncbi:MipA/OmpV family protein [Sphingomonas sp. ASV193]|uniref:MipA/OmpV family protein n=1 Tax=Sphingomonas sp. ASV193 TaxID=3144405 RepID=UPI0032E85369